MRLGSLLVAIAFLPQYQRQSTKRLKVNVFKNNSTERFLEQGIVSRICLSTSVHACLTLQVLQLCP